MQQNPYPMPQMPEPPQPTGLQPRALHRAQSMVKLKQVKECMTTVKETKLNPTFQKKEKGTTGVCFHEQREKLAEFLEDVRFQRFIVLIILIDLAVVVVEVFLEMAYPLCKKVDGHIVVQNTPHEVHEAENAFHIISLVLLFLLAAEVLALMCAFLQNFFRHPLFIVDFIIVSVALILDLVVQAIAAELLIFLRLWRIARLAHGIYMTVHEHIAELELHVAEDDSEITRLTEENEKLHAMVRRLQGTGGLSPIVENPNSGQLSPGPLSRPDSGQASPGQLVSRPNSNQFQSGQQFVSPPLSNVADMQLVSLPPPSGPPSGSQLVSLPSSSGQQHPPTGALSSGQFTSQAPGEWNSLMSISGVPSQPPASSLGEQAPGSRLGPLVSQPPLPPQQQQQWNSLSTQALPAGQGASSLATQAQNSLATQQVPSMNGGSQPSQPQQQWNSLTTQALPAGQGSSLATQTRNSLATQQLPSMNAGSLVSTQPWKNSLATQALPPSGAGGSLATQAPRQNSQQSGSGWAPTR